MNVEFFQGNVCTNLTEIVCGSFTHNEEHSPMRRFFWFECESFEHLLSVFSCSKSVTLPQAGSFDSQLPPSVAACVRGSSTVPGPAYRLYVGVPFH